MAQLSNGFGRLLSTSGISLGLLKAIKDVLSMGLALA